VNRIMAQNRRNLQDKVTQLEGLVSELQSGALSAEERVKFQNRVKELSDSLKTKEELAKQEAERLRKEGAEKIKELEEKFNSLQERYTGETITRAITDAAVANEAFSPPQIVAILRQTTYLDEELDEAGAPTGNLIAKAKITGKDEDGNETELDLTVGKAVEMMKTMPEKFGNLFKGTSTAGLGGDGNAISGQGGTPNIGKLKTEEYIRLRKEGKIDLSKI